ncbi:MAG: hypothetical protein WC055_00950 [Melioribacteraceae bacterium]
MWAIIFLITCVVELIICAYALIRNQWVFNQRRKIINSSTFENGEFHPFSDLPTCEEMLDGHGFCKWDINYYLSKK